MRLFANIEIYEVDKTTGLQKVYSIKEMKAEKAINEAISFVNRKYTANLFKNVKQIATNIKKNIQNDN